MMANKNQNPNPKKNQNPIIILKDNGEKPKKSNIRTYAEKLR
jgi:hypothetical protein